MGLWARAGAAGGRAGAGGPDIEELIDTAARLFDVSREDLIGPSRTHEVVLARQAAAWALHKRHPDLTLGQIGQLLGDRHYTTIIAAVTRAEQRARTDRGYARLLEALVRS